MASKCCKAKVQEVISQDFFDEDTITVATVNYICLKCGELCDIEKKKL